MDIQLHGVIDGKHIELEKETDLPPGSEVLVQIQFAVPDLQSQQRIIDSLCGAWAEDPSLPDIFANIQREREQAAPRNNDYDAPA